MATYSYPENRKYLTFEQRAADDPRYVKSAASKAKLFNVCRCGKTVVTDTVTCPRNCK